MQHIGSDTFLQRESGPFGTNVDGLLAAALDPVPAPCFLDWELSTQGELVESKRTLRIGLTLLVGLGLMLPAQLATARPEKQNATVEVDVIAEGLSAPRGLSFGPGWRELFVAESGKGGTGPCAVHPAAGEACFGRSGKITKIDDEGTSTFVGRLGSIAGAFEGLGPHDISVQGQRLVFTTGLGGPPELRAEFGSDAEKALGQLLSSERSSRRRGHVKRVADLVAFEAAENPDGGPIDSNPFGVLASGKWTYVADAGANALLRVSRKGKTQTVAVFPDRMVDFNGEQFSMDAVPTTVARGPDGRLYVGQLTGFPFPLGGAQIFRINRHGDPKVYATGFTNIIDIAFGRQGTLYVLEIAHNSLLSPEPEGALIRVRRNGTHEIVADGLFFPGGLALGKRGELYVTNCGICFDDGEVLRLTR